MGLGIGELLTGVGVKFAMYAHSGRYDKGYTSVLVTHKVIKAPDEPWTQEAKDRLQHVGREDTGNFDGHSLEQYRKIIETRRETDKMVLYVHGRRDADDELQRRVGGLTAGASRSSVARR